MGRFMTLGRDQAGIAGRFLQLVITEKRYLSRALGHAANGKIHLNFLLRPPRLTIRRGDPGDLCQT